jgi:hypothetical protein
MLKNPASRRRPLFGLSCLFKPDRPDEPDKQNKPV